MNNRTSFYLDMSVLRSDSYSPASKILLILNFYSGSIPKSLDRYSSVPIDKMVALTTLPKRTLERGIATLLKNKDLKKSEDNVRRELEIKALEKRKKVALTKYINEGMSIDIATELVKSEYKDLNKSVYPLSDKRRTVYIIPYRHQGQDLYDTLSGENRQCLSFLDFKRQETEVLLDSVLGLFIPPELSSHPGFRDECIQGTEECIKSWNSIKTKSQTRSTSHAAIYIMSKLCSIKTSKGIEHVDVLGPKHQKITSYFKVLQTIIKVLTGEKTKIPPYITKELLLETKTWASKFENIKDKDNLRDLLLADFQTYLSDDLYI